MERVGPWELHETLGRGGMGVVWRARHVGSGAWAALKTLHGLQPRHAAGIRREIRALSRLAHPGIVRVLDSGDLAGAPWYAMELVEGESLREHWRRTTTVGAASAHTFSLDDVGDDALPEGRKLEAGDLQSALAPFRSLCGPLAFLHGEGLVHRDLKPENVLVRPSGDAVLVDFGLVTRFDAAREGLVDVGDATAGTLAYMSPEQGRGEPVDARADLYALGCMLYERLTGRPPFATGSAQGILRAHRSEAPVPPSERVLGVPAELDALVLALLAKEPRQRPGHAGEVDAVLAALGVPGEPPSARPFLYRPGFEGRGAEVEATLAACRAGEPVLISAPSGAGKTRLVSEVVRRLRAEGYAILAGECAPPGPAPDPLRPVADALRPVVERCRERGPAAVRRCFGDRVRVLAPYQPALYAFAADEPPPPPLPASAARVRLFDAVASALAAYAEERPTALVLDDLQWADELTLGVVETLARHPPRGVAILAARRTGEGDLSRVEPAARAVALPELRDDAVEALVGAMLGGPAPEALSEHVAARADGNPFLAAELLRAMADEGALARTGAGWHVSGALPGGEAPILRRLRGLDEAQGRIVRAAAVLGREADVRDIVHVAGIGEPEAWDAVTELLRRQVLDEPEPGRVRFGHDRLREAAYAAIPDDRRAALHARAASAVPDGDPAVVARHLDLGGDAGAAAPHYLRAARAAAERNALIEAEGLFRAALRGLPPGRAAAEARVELARSVLRFGGAHARSVPDGEAALEEARRSGDDALVAEALDLLIGFLSHTTGRERLFALLDELDEVAARVGPAWRARALAVRTLALYRLGRIPEAAECVNAEIAALSGASDSRSRAAVASRAGMIFRELGQLDRAKAWFEEAVALHERGGQLFEAAVDRNNLAGLLVYSGQPDAAMPLFEQALAVHRASGAQLHEAYALHDIGETRFLQRRFAEARESWEGARALSEKLGDLPLAAASDLGVARCDLEAGDLAGAEARVLPAVALFRGSAQERDEGQALCVLGHVLVRRGADARPTLERAVELLRRQGAKPVEAEVVALLALDARRRGEPWEALAHEARALAEASGLPPAVDLVAELLA